MRMETITRTLYRSGFRPISTGNSQIAVIKQPTTTVIQTESETQIIHKVGIRAAVEDTLTKCLVESTLMSSATSLVISVNGICRKDESCTFRHD